MGFVQKHHLSQFSTPSILLLISSSCIPSFSCGRGASTPPHLPQSNKGGGRRCEVKSGRRPPRLGCQGALAQKRKLKEFWVRY